MYYLQTIKIKLLSPLFSLKRKFANNPQLVERYKEATDDYILKDHVAKLNQTDSKMNSTITNQLHYPPHSHQCKQTHSSKGGSSPQPFKATTP